MAVSDTTDPQQPIPPQAAPPASPVTAAAPPNQGAAHHLRRVVVGTPHLPPVSTGADLARTQVHPLWQIACFAAAMIMYVAFLPYFLRFSSPPTGDQPYYLLDIASIVQDGDLNVKNNYDQSDAAKFYALAPHPPDFVGMSAPDPLPPLLAETTARPDDEEYDAHLPGLALLLAPAWMIGSWFALWWPATIVMMGVLGALLAVNAMLLAHEMTGRLWIALVVWAAIAFSNPLMTYSYLIFTELPTGLLLIYALRRLARGWGDNGPLRLLAIGLCIAFMPWLATRCVLIAIPLGVYAAVQWWRYWRPLAAPSGDAPSRARTLMRSVLSAAWVAMPILVSVALLFGFNLFRFGVLVPDAAQSTGQDEVFYWPSDGPFALTQFLTHAFGILFDIQWGFLIYAPVYVLAVVGMIVMWRSGRAADRRLLAVGLACAAAYWFVIIAYRDWNGEWSPPARYLTTFVALLAAPLAMSLWAARTWIYRVIFALLAGLGFGGMAIMLFRPIRMWPFGDGRLFYGGVFDWLAQSPNAPVHFDLTHVLPSFLTPDELHQPLMTGAVIAIAFALVLLGTLLMRVPRSPEKQRARPAPAPLLMWTGAALVVGAGWWDVNLDFLQAKTVLVEQHRWPLPDTLHEAHGIAYLDGKIYIASLGARDDEGVLQSGAGELGAFDLSTGVYAPVLLTGDDANLAYALPGDVKVGADGMLYLLNSGSGAQDLYVLQPDGHVVRQVPLEGRLPLSLGLALGPKGTIYATDMAEIHQYGADGGPASAVWGGADESFTNVMGLALTPDGHIYGAESSRKRLQELDSTGQVLAVIDMRCQPLQMALQGDWIDIACDQGLRSINWHTNSKQIAQVADGAPPLESPTALTYGPDGTLYVLDNTSLISYTVQH